MPMLSNGPSRLLGGGRVPLAVPVPVLGAEMIVNGDMEIGDPPGSWTATDATISAVAGYNSPQALRGVRVANNTLASQAVVASTGTWLLSTGAVKSGNNAFVQLSLGNSYTSTPNSTGTWQEYVLIGRVTTLAGKALNLIAPTAPGNQGDFDNVSLRPITLASMFSARPYSTHATAKARVTVVARSWAGVVANLDSTSAPANFVIASHDGTTARLTKCVAGAYTELVSQAVAYVAGAYVEVRRLAGTDTWQLWYNGAQVGANQTISDAAIKAATLHGYFTTYAGNTLTGFSCTASV